MGEIVQNCCQVNSTSVLSIDTTFNVGKFYVTSTTYQNRNLINQRTGKCSNSPGPALFHVPHDEPQFFYFSYTECKVFGKLVTEIIILYRKVLQRDLLATFGFIKIDFIMKKCSFVSSASNKVHSHYCLVCISNSCTLCRHICLINLTQPFCCLFSYILYCNVI